MGSRLVYVCCNPSCDYGRAFPTPTCPFCGESGYDVKTVEVKE